MSPKKRFDQADGVLSSPLGKMPYPCPVSRVIELGTMLDVCSNVSGNTDPFNPNPGGGWEDEFGN